jgi:hypothetical protein
VTLKGDLISLLSETPSRSSVLRRKAAAIPAGLRCRLDEEAYTSAGNFGAVARAAWWRTLVTNSTVLCLPIAKRPGEHHSILKPPYLEGSCRTTKK